MDYRSILQSRGRPRPYDPRVSSASGAADGHVDKAQLQEMHKCRAKPLCRAPYRRSAKVSIAMLDREVDRLSGGPMTGKDE